MSTALVNVYSQEVRSSDSGSAQNKLVVSEQLLFVGVCNGGSIDFYDLALQEPEDGLHAMKFLASVRLGDSPTVEAALSPHDPTVLAAGTASGSIAECKMSLPDWQKRGEDKGSTVAKLPADKEIIGWARKLLGF